MIFIKKLCFYLALAAATLNFSGCQTTPPPAEPEKKAGLSAEQTTALQQQGFVESDEGWEFSASEKLLFGANEATLQANAKEAVGRIARLLVKLEIPAVRVDGHTDSTGSASYNDQLSLRRAQIVADVIIAAGMSSSHVTVRGLGSRSPIAGNNTAEGRAQNRRVVLVIGNN
ncbi:MAG: OmpA family protein [Azonexus sp.]|nr:OmpA family protein [Azonexus sp.]